MKFILWILALCIFTSVLGDKYVVEVGNLIHRTDERYLSYTLDTTNIQSKWVHENISSEKFLQVSKPLAPAYFRIGGTTEDQIIFQENAEDSIDVPSNYDYFVLTGEDFVKLNEYAVNAGVLLVYGLNAQVREGSNWNPLDSPFNSTNARQLIQFADNHEYDVVWQLGNGEDFVKLNEYAVNAGVLLVYGLNAQVREGSNWNPLDSPFNSTNARQLIQFADNHEYDVVWQLGNEPDLYSGNYKTTPSQIAKDFQDLKDVLKSFPRYTQLIGPDTSGAGNFLNGFIEYGKSAVSAITWHQYYENGETAKLNDFINADVLNRLESSISSVQDAMDKVDSNLPIWLSETSSAYRGGAPNISDRFVAGFPWIDKLGMSAVKGVAVVTRQQIFGLNYPLLDSNLDPNPDWWLSVLFKRLVGVEVLEVPVPTGDVRLYAHCVSSRAEQPAGAVVLYGSNLANEETQLDVSTIVGSGGATKVLAYVLTGETGLDSKTVLLNNNRLELGGDDSIPELNPVEIDSDSITLPPQSLVFYVFPDVKHADC